MLFANAQYLRGAAARSALASALAGLISFFAIEYKCSAGLPPFLFDYNQVIPIGSNESPKDVAVGDFNQDFRPDLVVAADGEPRGFFLIMGQSGKESFAPPVLVTIDSDAPGSHLGRSILVADMNNDGFQDVIFGRDKSGVTVSPGHGDGTFGAPVQVLADVDSYDPFLWPLRLRVLELDGDGDLDLLIANGRTGQLYVARNDGNLNLAIIQTFQLFGATEIDPGDIDGDGLDEVTWTQDGSLFVLPNSGTGQFDAPVGTELKSGQSAYTFDLVDLDIDGDLDILFARPGSTFGTLGIMLNDGTGQFGAETHYTIPAFAPLDIAIADFDGDQRVDIAILEATGIVYFLQNQTTVPGQFVFSEEYSIESSGFVTLRIGVANFDADCDHDLVVVNGVTSNVAVLRNLSAQFNQCTVADFNYSGEVDGDDLSFLLGEWGKAGSPADLDLSGRVEGWDLAILLWGWQQPVP